MKVTRKFLKDSYKISQNMSLPLMVSEFHSLSWTNLAAIGPLSKLRKQQLLKFNTFWETRHVLHVAADTIPVLH